MPGFSSIRKINKYLYFDFAMQFPIGTEELTSFDGSKDSYFIYGIAPYQRFLFVPKRNIGVTLGIGFYEKLLDSKVYANDLGVRFDLGIKF